MATYSKRGWKKFKSRDGKLANRLKKEFNTNIELGKYNVLSAGTGVGKTHLSIQEFSYDMVENKNVSLITFTAPEKVVISKSTINKHIKSLRRKLKEKFITILWSPKESEIITAFDTKDDDEIIFIIMTDSLFNKRVDLLQDLIIKHNLGGKVISIFDECHISGTSHKSYYKENHGLDNPNATCIKFSSIEKLIELSWILGVTATLLKEQMDETFGTDKYKVINTVVTKEEIALAVSGHRPTKFYDEDKDMETLIMDFFGYTTSHQTYLDILQSNYNLPDHLNPKITGMVVLETKYKEKLKDDKKKFMNFMNDDNMTIPKNWNFDVALDTSEELEVWRFRDKKITLLSEEERISCGYYDSDSVVSKMEDKDSPIRFLILVGKGSVGMDILPLNFCLSLRTFGNHVGETPITHRGIQILGRCRRLVIPIEDLTPYFDDFNKLMNYYTNVNFYQAFLPDSNYWKSTQETIDEKYPSIDEIENYISNKL